MIGEPLESSGTCLYQRRKMNSWPCTQRRDGNKMFGICVALLPEQSDVTNDTKASAVKHAQRQQQAQQNCNSLQTWSARSKPEQRLPKPYLTFFSFLLSADMQCSHCCLLVCTTTLHSRATKSVTLQLQKHVAHLGERNDCHAG